LTSRDLVLVGGGHTHVQVLRRLAMRPLAAVRTTVVLDRPTAVYSGMVPGFVAGQYATHELEIDVRPLARRAGARVVVAAAVGVDARRAADRAREPGADRLRRRELRRRLARRGTRRSRRARVRDRDAADRTLRRRGGCARRASTGGARRLPRRRGGAGAAGIEVALAVRGRLAREGARAAHVAVVDAAARVLPGMRPGVAARATRALQRRDVALHLGAGVAGAEPGAVVLTNGERIPFDALLWATGAASHGLFAASGLATDDRGFVRVRPTLQLADHDDLFAVGDCARFEPDLPKSGVFAVRQGPVLDHNLRARLAGRRLRAYRPQRDTLVLLNLGDGTALGTKWGRAVEGPRVFRVKDAIDRRFVRRFQVLDAAGTPARDFPPMEPAADMLCGGCAAKVGESVLTRALARLDVPRDDRVVMGLAAPDDAAAVLTPRGDVVVATIDGFRPFVDDPWLLGRVAATNAASDVFAKGAAPRFALAQVAIPEEDPVRAEELLYQVLAGARAALDAEGIALVGGHTTAGDALAVGFAVWGDAPEPLLRIGGLAPGDQLVLTKPIGTGVLFHADMRGLARGDWIESAVASMLRSNASAARVAREVGATACTDVTGFGLAGHLGAMLRASKVSAHLALDAIPLLPGRARAPRGRGSAARSIPRTRRRAARSASRAPRPCGPSSMRSSIRRRRAVSSSAFRPRASVRHSRDCASSATAGRARRRSAFARPDGRTDRGRRRDVADGLRSPPAHCASADS
jgi:selenide,water dikinase